MWPAPHLSSVVQDRKAQMAEARGVGDRFDLDDLATYDREILELLRQPFVFVQQSHSFVSS